MPDDAPSPETFFKAFGLLSHLYLTPVLGALIEGRVPDHLDAGPLTASELASRTARTDRDLVPARAGGFRRLPGSPPGRVRQHP